MAGAVHRLDGERALFIFQREHILAEFFPVARFFPEYTINENRGLHLNIAILTDLGTDVVFERAVKRPTFVVPEYLTLRFFLDMEQLQLTPQLTMVALGRFLHHVLIGLQFLLIGERYAVD